MMTDYAEFLCSFERCEIDADAFRHVDHVGVAFEMLQKYDFLQAFSTYAQCLSVIAEKTGAGDKFNTTVTMGYFSLIAERMHENTYPSFGAFIDDNEDLLSGNPLEKWCSKERLGSDTARRVFLMPDMAGS